MPIHASWLMGIRMLFTRVTKRTVLDAGPLNTDLFSYELEDASPIAPRKIHPSVSRIAMESWAVT